MNKTNTFKEVCCSFDVTETYLASRHNVPEGPGEPWNTTMHCSERKQHKTYSIKTAGVVSFHSL